MLGVWLFFHTEKNNFGYEKIFGKTQLCARPFMTIFLRKETYNKNKMKQFKERSLLSYNNRTEEDVSDL